MEEQSRDYEGPCERLPVLIAGGGFLGSALACALRETGTHPSVLSEPCVLTRSESSAEALRREHGLDALACDFPAPGALEAALGSRRFSAVIACASSRSHGKSPQESEAAYRRIYEQGTRALLEFLRSSPGTRVLFVSSTSVYAQTDGSIVTEESETSPKRETGRILLAAERLVLNAGGIVARLGGLYGNERWISRDRLINGTATLEGDGSQWLNLIHRDDAVTALILLLTNPANAGIYNVTDGAPISRLEFYSTLATALSAPLPPFGPRRSERKRGWSHKRVLPARLNQLGWRPQFPTFRAALAAGH